MKRGSRLIQTAWGLPMANLRGQHGVGILRMKAMKMTEILKSSLDRWRHLVLVGSSYIHVFSPLALSVVQRSVMKIGSRGTGRQQDWDQMGCTEQSQTLCRLR